MAPVPYLNVNLSDQERLLLSTGISQWDGPAQPTNELAHLMGFRDVAHLHGRSHDLLHRLEEGEPLTRGDLEQLLAATELVFVSNRWGAGLEWEW